MGYYNCSYYKNSLCHSAKRDLNGESVSKEKGTDGKANNTSAYNHDYYMRNKDKWGVKTQEYTKGDSDFDNTNLKEQNRIGNTNFFAFRNKKGEWVVTEEDMKWTLPKGAELTPEIKKKLASLEGKKFDTKTVESILKSAGKGTSQADNKNTENQEKETKEKTSADGDFDLEAAALDVIRGKYKNGAERKAALGDDYKMIQDRVNEIYKQGLYGVGDSSKKTSKKK